VARSARKKHSKATPSARGGPGANRGHDYQINCALFWSLELITKYFAAPHQSWAITLEPRIVYDSHAVSRWDIRTDPQTVVWEAKVKVTKHDIDEWLARIRDTEDCAENVSFGLAYSGSHTPVLNTVKHLKDLATECGVDRAKFDRLSTEDGESASVISTLGSSAFACLERMRFEQIPEDLLGSNLQFRARYLAGSESDRLIDFLFRMFSEGATERRRYEIQELIERCTSAGIPLTPPGNIALAEVPTLAQRAIIVLKACRHGMLKQVLTGALNASTEDVQEALRELVARRIIVDQEDMWRLAAWPHPAPTEGREEILTACFDQLLDWLKDYEMSPAAVGQLYNAMEISLECLRRRPGLALKFFQSTEHVIKNLGDKHLLLEMSELCVAAAKDSSPQDRDLRAKALAQAYMCGHSWVFQRTGRLREARMYAQKSLELGEAIGWARNTAFAKKCLGRMDRREAEGIASPAERTRLLADSETKLVEAIALFSESEEFGPTDRQVGDCYSLLGRTQLVARKLNAATESIRKAHAILPEAPTKEHMDLLILTGDLEVAKGNREDADSYYDRVIEWSAGGNREISEIRARAYMQRGQSRRRRGHKDAAKADFERAASIWHSLEEHKQAADAQWAVLKIDGIVDEKTLRMFDDGESRLVAVTAVQEYIDRLSATKAYARRKQPTRPQVEQMLKQARKKVAQEYPDW